MKNSFHQNKKLSVLSALVVSPFFSVKLPYLRASVLKHFSVLSALVVIFTLSSCSHKQKADLILHHGIIYTVDSAFTTAESFAVKDGKFVAVGTNDEILNNFESSNIIDAQGKAVYPGFIDSHCHFYAYGKGLHEIDLVGTHSFEEVIEKLKSQKSEIRASSWIIGRGWDQNDWANKEYPDNTKLNELFPDVPVLLERIDGHAALVNNEALKRCGITAGMTVSGGIIEMKNGKLTGILVDNAVDKMKKAIPKPDEAEIKNALLAAEKNCFAVGLTTVDDAGLEKKIIDVIDGMQKDNKLKMRIYAMLTDNKENFDHYLNSGPYKTEKLDVRSFKFYADGALGSRGACLIKPYSDKPGERGFLLSKPAYFDSLANILVQKGFQMNTHCIGDSAVRLMCSIYLKHLISNSTASPAPLSYRWRIEHAQVVEPEDLKYFSGIIPSVQPTHATSDMYWAKDRLGEERVKCAYAYNDLLKTTGMIALGTDFPVEDINPLYTFYAAVSRQDLKGFPDKGFQPENALSKENTLRGMTSWGAYANFEEKEKGSIEANKFADFVILENDIMKCDVKKVPETKVERTYLNGECVYSRSAKR